MNKPFLQSKQAFTLVEMLVVMGLVFIMAAMSMANYNQFGQEIELENGVYELALTVRQAQFFGINRSEQFGGSTFDDPQPYGVFFDLDASAAGVDDRSFVMFIDQNSNRIFDHNDVDGNPVPGNCIANLSDECVNWYGFNRRNYISDICVGANEASCTSLENILPSAVPRTLHVTFKRPDPDAEIRAGNISTPFAYAKITVTSPDVGKSKAISIGAAGQITLERD